MKKTETLQKKMLKRLFFLHLCGKGVVILIHFLGYPFKKKLLINKLRVYNNKQKIRFL